MHTILLGNNFLLPPDCEYDRTLRESLRVWSVKCRVASQHCNQSAITLLIYLEGVASCKNFKLTHQVISYIIYLSVNGFVHYATIDILNWVYPLSRMI